MVRKLKASMLGALEAGRHGVRAGLEAEWLDLARSTLIEVGGYYVVRVGF